MIGPLAPLQEAIRACPRLGLLFARTVTDARGQSWVVPKHVRRMDNAQGTGWIVACSGDSHFLPGSATRRLPDRDPLTGVQRCAGESLREALAYLGAIWVAPIARRTQIAKRRPPFDFMPVGLRVARRYDRWQIVITATIAGESRLYVDIGQDGHISPTRFKAAVRRALSLRDARYDRRERDRLLRALALNNSPQEHHHAD